MTWCPLRLALARLVALTCGAVRAPCCAGVVGCALERVASGCCAPEAGGVCCSHGQAVRTSAHDTHHRIAAALAHRWLPPLLTRTPGATPTTLHAGNKRWRSAPRPMITLHRDPQPQCALGLARRWVRVGERGVAAAVVEASLWIQRPRVAARSRLAAGARATRQARACARGWNALSASGSS